MEVCQTIAGIREYVRRARERGAVGLVPTMGYFHEGHLTLMREAAKVCPTVVVSIFVNPLQFGPTEDFRDYPRESERDLALARETGVHAVFMPDTAEMYPLSPALYVEVERMDTVLCGRSRPGHFRGVATVVAKLFNIVRPDSAVFGQKDAQQLQIIRRMVRDLNFDLEVRAVPTVRDSDGLALSSRNIYLNAEQRVAATVLFRSLETARRAIQSGERSRPAIEKIMVETISAEPLAELDYASVYRLPDLEPVDSLDGELILAVAARFGKARLIDNITMRIPG
ncbi:MAG: pantoate--beta-alanine ligase [Clostridia bacterium]|nr:pantoate--beta-alanine ligase [Clostridia bacterium]MDQ7791912.1 pantoate--beta-alanine ligase [Clostridia bacterium]